MNKSSYYEDDTVPQPEQLRHWHYDHAKGGNNNLELLEYKVPPLDGENKKEVKKDE